MKQAILNSVIGRVAFAARAKTSLLFSALLQPESVGMMANDQLSTQLITRICLPNKTFIDVGAHIGSVISEVHAEDKSVDIVAIEAIPEKVTNLKRKFPYAKIHPCAAGESEGDVSFFIDLAQSGYSSMFRPAGRDKRLKEITVPMRKLDDIVPSGNVDAIKIDVEGAELGVLRGAENLLSEDRPTIMLESAPIHTNIPGYSKDALWRYLTERDYCILVPNRVAHNDDGLSFEGFIDSHTWPRRTTNYFAVPKERRREIRDRVRLLLGISTDQQKPVREATKPTAAATLQNKQDSHIYVENIVCNRLRALRAEHGWSQATLAEKLGVSMQTVNAIEVGKFDPSLPLAFSVAKLFGQNIEEIFDLGKDMESQAGSL